jgi:ligand-binding SRPBCC domain-containing protein
VSGPFAEWVHRHNFEVVDEHTTEVVDEITLRLRSHPLWWLVGIGMWLGLPSLFAYRTWKTRRTLQ